MNIIEILYALVRPLTVIKHTCDFGMWSFFSFTAPMACNQESVDASSNLDPLYQRLMREAPQSIWGFEPQKDWLAEAHASANALSELFFAGHQMFASDPEFLSIQYDAPRSPQATHDAFVGRKPSAEGVDKVNATVEALGFNVGLMESEDVRDYRQEAIDAAPWALTELSTRIPTDRVIALYKTFEGKANDVPNEMPPALSNTGYSVEEALTHLTQQSSPDFDPVEAVASNMLTSECLAIAFLLGQIERKPALEPAVSGLLFERKTDAVMLASLGVEPNLDRIKSRSKTALRAKHVVWPGIDAAS